MKTAKNVYILTGFLGAGKTSFLNYVLKNRKEKRYAVIENEIGQIGIDADLLISEKNELISLNDGCLCCTMSNGLYDALSLLFDKRDEYDEIFIECTGIADPAAIAEPFLSQPEIAKFFDLRAVIALVDTENFEEQIANAPEVIRQLAFSDVIVLNKTDVAAPEQSSSVFQKITALQPFAKIVGGCKDDFPLSEIFAEDAIFSTEKFEQEKSKFTENEFRHGEIMTVSLLFEQVFDAKYLLNRLQQYVFFQAQDLFRFKAIVACKGETNYVVLQSVMKQLNVDIAHERGENSESRFVFIGKNLEKSALIKMLNTCLDRPRIEF